MFVGAKYVDGEWTDAFTQACPGAGTSSYEGSGPAYAYKVQPGSTFVDSISLRGSLQPNTNPGFTADRVPGTYRLVFYIYSRWSDDPSQSRKLLPEQERVSNAFELMLDG